MSTMKLFFHSGVRQWLAHHHQTRPVHHAVGGVEMLGHWVWREGEGEGEGEGDPVILCICGRIKIPCRGLGEGLTGHVEEAVEGEAGRIKADRSATCTAVLLWEGPVGGDSKHWDV